MITSYLDICIHLHLNRNIIINLHIIAIPVHERYMAAGIFVTVAKDL